MNIHLSTVQSYYYCLCVAVCVCVCVCVQIFDELEEQVDDTIDSFNYTSDSFLDNSTRSALNDFSDSSVDSINITGIYMYTVYMYNDVYTL